KHKSVFFLPLLILAAVMIFAINNCGDNGTSTIVADGGNYPDGGQNDGGNIDAGCCHPDGGQGDGGTHPDGGILDGGNRPDGGIHDGGTPALDGGCDDGGCGDGGEHPDAGCDGIASVMLIEVNQKITYGLDMIRLIITACGNLNGIIIHLNPGVSPSDGKALLAALPDLNVANGDIVIIHLGPTTDGGVQLAVTETNASGKTGCPESNGCYNYAWDIVGVRDGIPNSERVLAVGATGNDGGMYPIQDAVPFVNDASPSENFAKALKFAQDNSAWLPPNCDGGVCSNSSVPSASEISVNWSGCGNTVTGKSMQRTPMNADTNRAGDWTLKTANFNGLNP
ncbi:MAG: hypothetical protein V1928_05710, partial [Parcubacteria group bacterium]